QCDTGLEDIPAAIDQIDGEDGEPHRTAAAAKIIRAARRAIDRIRGIEDVARGCTGLDRLLRSGVHLGVEIVSGDDVRRRLVANIDAGLRAGFVVVVNAPYFERDDIALRDPFGGR